jgi:hypothetical protein
MEGNSAMSVLLESALTATQRAEAEAADMAQRNGLPAALAGAFVPLVWAKHNLPGRPATPAELDEKYREEAIEARRERLMEERAERDERGL